MIRENISNLPDGWICTTIGEIYNIIGGGTPSTTCSEYWDGNIPWITSGDIYGINDIRPKRFITQEAIKSSATNLVPPETLIVVTRVSLGKLAKTKTPMCFSQDSQALVDGNNIIFPDYALYYLSEAVKAFKYEHRGTTISGVPKRQLAELKILVPPLAEQHRIVAKLDELLAGVNAARDRLAKVPGLLKRFRQSILAAACSGRLTADWREMQQDLDPVPMVLERILKERRLEWETNQIAEFQAKGINPKNQNWKARYKEPLSVISEDLPELPENWSWATIEQLGASEANAITDGPFGSNLKTSHYTSRGPRVIRLQNIGEGVFINESAHISDKHYETLAKHRINAGDLVIAALGAKLPRTCIIPSFVGPAIVKADCIRFKPDPGLAIAHYLNYVLNEESARHRIASFVHGVARPRLNLSEIKAIAIPIPPMAEQHEIVRRVEALFRLADAIEARVAAAAARADKLTQAVLAKAFRGELVPTEAELARREGRDYEPAATLLKRIQEERQATGALKLQKKSTKRQRVKDRAHG